VTGREGQTFALRVVKSGVKKLYLIVGTVHDEECGFEVWRAVNLFTNEETVFSEDFLKIKEKSSRLT
jgi:hypothetical protein